MTKGKKKLSAEMQVTMLRIVRSNVLQLLIKSLVLVWSERMDSLDADTLHKPGFVCR